MNHLGWYVQERLGWWRAEKSNKDLILKNHFLFSFASILFLLPDKDSLYHFCQFGKVCFLPSFSVLRQLIGILLSSFNPNGFSDGLEISDNLLKGEPPLPHLHLAVDPVYISVHLILAVTNKEDIIPISSWGWQRLNKLPKVTHQ